MAAAGEGERRARVRGGQSGRLYGGEKGGEEAHMASVVSTVVLLFCLRTVEEDSDRSWSGPKLGWSWAWPNLDSTFFLFSFSFLLFLIFI